jgi:hypothetical protein
MPGGWGDPDGDCRSVRHDILFETSEIEPTTTADGCRVTAGRWTDPYTGDILTTADEATIDHHIPLAEGHRSGGWRWDLDTKFRFSHDPGSGQLSVVGQAVNQAKADKRPDQWLPPLGAEAASIRDVVADCPSTESPVGLIAEPGPEIVTSTTAAPTTTTIEVAVGSLGSVTLVSCQAPAEVVTLVNRGSEPVSLSGYLLNDEGDKHQVSLG